MVFSSIIFLFYFLPTVLFLYFTIGQLNIRIKNCILLLASFFFYAWGEPKNVFLLIGSCLFNYMIGLLIDRYRDKSKVKISLLIVAVLFNLGLLFVFKYFNFAIENIGALLSVNVLTIDNLALPIGISFFTFQAMSYIIDVYRNQAKVQKNPFTLALYIALFPQLVAGPIVRYNTIEDQLKHRKETMDQFSAGVCRFILGLAKKIILANAFAIIADNIYGITQLWHTQYLVPAALAWIGTFAYTFQIFFDFSAYSDMAIGLGKMFGFEFEENFNYPYVSKSIREFWSRWHISLTTWFREYLYFPLGGSRVENRDKLVRNLAVVWLATGIWHGANWTFILWGVWNFMFIVIERFVNFDKIECRSIYKHIYTLFVVNFSWVLFRAENIDKFIEYTKNMFCLNDNGVFSPMVWMFIRENIFLIVIAVIACLPPSIWKKKFDVVLNKMHISSSVVAYSYPFAMTGLFIICVVYLIRGGYNPFIYFNF